MGRRVKVTERSLDFKYSSYVEFVREISRCEMKSKFFIKYLTSCWNARVIAYHRDGLFPSDDKRQHREPMPFDFYQFIVCKKNWIITESEARRKKEKPLKVEPNHNRMKSFMLSSHPLTLSFSTHTPKNSSARKSFIKPGTERMKKQKIP